MTKEKKIKEKEIKEKKKPKVSKEMSKEMKKELSKVKKELTMKIDLKEKQEEQEIILTDFYAIWCGPCKIQDPILDELKKKFSEKIKFEKLDIDKNMKIADKFKVRSVPTLIIQKNGIVVNKFVGVTSKKILENELNNLLKNIY